MKKLIRLAMGAACVCLTAGSSFAVESELEAHGLYAFGFNDDDTSGDYVENTFGGGAAFVIEPHKNIKLDLGADYFRTEHKLNSDAKYQFIPITAAFRFGSTLEGIFIYAGAGVGYSFNSYDESGISSSDIDLDDSMIYFACGGAEFGLSEKLYIRGEFRYNWLRPELKWFGSKVDLEFDHMQMRAGIGYKF